jgi:hypothetical protein
MTKLGAFRVKKYYDILVLISLSFQLCNLSHYCVNLGFHLLQSLNVLLIVLGLHGVLCDPKKKNIPMQDPTIAGAAASPPATGKTADGTVFCSFR